MERQTNHSLSIDNRKRLSACGVSEVLGFNEREIRASLTGGGKILVYGDKLAIDAFSKQTGEITLSGFISAVKYSDLQSVSLKKIFK